MSVYQVEEYYIYINVPEEKLVDVKRFIDNCDELACQEHSFSGSDLVIDNFDCESHAKRVSDQIHEIIG